MQPFKFTLRLILSKAPSLRKLFTELIFNYK